MTEDRDGLGKDDRNGAASGSAEEDAALDQLLRRALEATPEDPIENFVPPAPDAVDAYLLGTASEEEQEEMHRALARSRALRAEILDLSEDLARMGEVETERRFDAVRVGEARRSRSSLLSRLARHPGIAYAAALALAAVLAFRTFLAPVPGPTAPSISPGSAAPPPAAGGLVVADLDEDKRIRGAHGGLAPREIRMPSGTDELLLRLRIDPVEGDEAGAYAVEVREGALVVLTQTRRRVDLLHGRVLPVIVEAARLRDGGSYVARVSYSERGHDLDDVILLESRFTIRTSRSR